MAVSTLEPIVQLAVLHRTASARLYDHHDLFEVRKYSGEIKLIWEEMQSRSEMISICLLGSQNQCLELRDIKSQFTVRIDKGTLFLQIRADKKFRNNLVSFIDLILFFNMILFRVRYAELFTATATIGLILVSVMILGFSVTINVM